MYLQKKSYVTIHLTPSWREVFLEKLIGIQLLNQSIAFHGMLITCHRSLL